MLLISVHQRRLAVTLGCFTGFLALWRVYRKIEIHLGHEWCRIQHEPPRLMVDPRPVDDDRRRQPVPHRPILERPDIKVAVNLRVVRLVVPKTPNSHHKPAERSVVSDILPDDILVRALRHGLGVGPRMSLRELVQFGHRQRSEFITVTHDRAVVCAQAFLLSWSGTFLGWPNSTNYALFAQKFVNPRAKDCDKALRIVCQPFLDRLS